MGNPFVVARSKAPDRARARRQRAIPPSSTFRLHAAAPVAPLVVPDSCRMSIWRPRRSSRSPEPCTPMLTSDKCSNDDLELAKKTRLASTMRVCVTPNVVNTSRSSTFFPTSSAAGVVRGGLLAGGAGSCAGGTGGASGADVGADAGASAGETVAAAAAAAAAASSPYLSLCFFF